VRRGGEKHKWFWRGCSLLSLGSGENYCNFTCKYMLFRVVWVKVGAKRYSRLSILMGEGQSPMSAIDPSVFTNLYVAQQKSGNAST